MAVHSLRSPQAHVQKLPPLVLSPSPTHPRTPRFPSLLSTPSKVPLQTPLEVPPQETLFKVPPPASSPTLISFSLYTVPIEIVVVYGLLILNTLQLALVNIIPVLHWKKQTQIEIKHFWRNSANSVQVRVVDERTAWLMRAYGSVMFQKAFCSKTCILNAIDIDAFSRWVAGNHFYLYTTIKICRGCFFKTLPSSTVGSFLEFPETVSVYFLTISQIFENTFSIKWLKHKLSK